MKDTKNISELDKTYWVDRQKETIRICVKTIKEYFPDITNDQLVSVSTALATNFITREYELTLEVMDDVIRAIDNVNGVNHE